MSNLQDPRTSVEAYLEVHKLPQLLEALTAQLLFLKPDVPRTFIVKYLEAVQCSGTPPLINKSDLETMFSMFDVTSRGTVTSEQASAALGSILGPKAPAPVLLGNKLLKKDDFVEVMLQAISAASPYPTGFGSMKQ